MSEIKVTQTLRDTIKKYRKEIHLRGDVLSRTLKKNTSFISQLETGKLETIDSETLSMIFDELFKEELPENKIKKIDAILNQLQLSLSDRELERQSWMRIMDLQYRLIPIPDSIITYINEQLGILQISPEDIIHMVNENKSLYAGFSEDEIKEMEDNKVYSTFSSSGNRTYIKFNLSPNFLSDILSGKVVRCNFITLQGIINAILLANGANIDEAYDESEKILFENKFYTLLKKQDLSKNNAENLAPYDIEFKNNLKKLNKILSEINDAQPDFLNEILEPFIDNILKEPALTFSIINKDISTLHKMSNENKKNFINDFKTLISEYETNSIESIKKIETF